MPANDPLQVRKARKHAVDLTVPLPLGYIPAVEQAWKLCQNPRLSWTAIGIVMREYHGWDRTGQWWKRRVDAAGLGYPDRNNNHAPMRPGGGRLDHPRGLRGYLAGINNGPGGES